MNRIISKIANLFLNLFESKSINRNSIKEKKWYDTITNETIEAIFAIFIILIFIGLMGFGLYLVHIGVLT
jgi:hypothetical protein